MCLLIQGLTVYPSWSGHKKEEVLVHVYLCLFHLCLIDTFDPAVTDLTTWPLCHSDFCSSIHTLTVVSMSDPESCALYFIQYVPALDGPRGTMFVCVFTKQWI